jgi:hypothetical protein
LNTKKINFLIVGCAKCGSSSLYNYICDHPKIIPAKVKEPGYFAKNSLLKQNGYHEHDTWEKYMECFPETNLDAFSGEASVSYFNYMDESIPAIKKSLGSKVKIIIILRNPIKRMISGYNYALRIGIESREISEVLSSWNGNKEIIDPNTNRPCYVANGLYSERVQKFIEEFDDVKIIFSEELYRTPNKVMGDIFNFLKVENVKNFDNYPLYNKGGYSPRIPWLRKLLLNDNFIVEGIRKNLPYHGYFRNSLRKVRKFFDIFMMKESVSVENNQILDKLHEFYRNDIEQLERLLGIDLSGWKK